MRHFLNKVELNQIFILPSKPILLHCKGPTENLKDLSDYTPISRLKHLSTIALFVRSFHQIRVADLQRAEADVGHGESEAAQFT